MAVDVAGFYTRLRSRHPSLPACAGPRTVAAQSIVNSMSLYIYIISLILLSLSLLLAKCALLGHPVLCHQKVMVFFVTCSLRRWALRGIWTAILVLGLCQAAKVNKAVYCDLPHDPIHWNRHLTMVRSLLGAQHLGLKYTPLGGSS